MAKQEKGQVNVSFRLRKLYSDFGNRAVVKKENIDPYEKEEEKAPVFHERLMSYIECIYRQCRPASVVFLVLNSILFLFFPNTV